MDAGRVVRRVATVSVAIAASLAVASYVHLAGHVRGRNGLFDSDDAGIAEAIIALVLVAGAIAMVSVPRRARAVGLASNGFALVGFAVGLTITAQAGHLPDIADHSAILPVLVASVVVLLRIPRERAVVRSGTEHAGS